MLNRRKPGDPMSDWNLLEPDLYREWLTMSTSFLNVFKQLLFNSGTQTSVQTGVKLYHFETRVLESLHGAA
jgi:hypothetical protein